MLVRNSFVQSRSGTWSPRAWLTHSGWS